MNIPFMAQVTEEGKLEQGARVNVVASSNEYPKGYSDKTTFADAKGVWISGLANFSGNFEGLSVSGLHNKHGSYDGVCAAGLGNTLFALSGYSVAALWNYAANNIGSAVQIGLFNKIKNYEEDSAVIQIGLINRAGNQTCPFVNIRGWGSLFGMHGEESRGAV